MGGQLLQVRLPLRESCSYFGGAVGSDAEAEAQRKRRGWSASGGVRRHVALKHARNPPCACNGHSAVCLQLRAVLAAAK